MVAVSRVWLGAIGVSIAVSLGVWWWSGDHSTRPRNVVLITLDTLRADHLGAYGATQVRTPSLDRLAGEGVVFDQVMSTAPLTLPAHSSIMTGHFPPRHGVRDNGGFFLSPEQTTLAEVLAAQGFRTGATVGAFVLDSKWGLDQGFEKYQDDFDLTNVRAMSLASVKRPGNEVVDLALGWMSEVADQPFFAWMHLYDPHAPYESPDEFRNQYPGHPYRGAIAFTDAQVGRVLDFLEQRGLADNTLVIVTADHGEGLGEHGEETHGFFVYQSTMRVPLIMRVPGRAGGPARVTQPVRSVDIMPTVLDLLGVPEPGPMEGTTLVPLLTGAARELGRDLVGYGEAMYPLHHYGWSELTSLRSDRFKLIDAPRPELYDLEQDPGELRNLFEERRSVADVLLRELRDRRQQMSEAAPAAKESEEVDPETRARLAALGYVGSFVATDTGPSSSRADPKDKIGLFNLMSNARDLSKGSEDPGAAAITMLRQVVAEDPQVIDAWFMLGNEFFKQEAWTEAIDMFRRALELKPDYDLAIINMANAYRRLGRDDAALAGYERYVQIDPKNAYVRYQIGEIYLDRGELQRAGEEFAEALSIDPKLASATVATGAIALQRGDVTRATELLREALALKKDVRLAHFNLGVIAEGRQDWSTAEAEYLAELEVHASAYKAAFNLGRLHARRQNPRAATEWYRKSIEINDTFAEGHFYLAKSLLEEGRDLPQAITLARRGLSLQPEGEISPMGHFVIGSALMQQGRQAEADRELAAGLALEKRLAVRGGR
jgi:arylsulfatase A-like enzyme/Tfp pilus assembly protein PilF